MSSVHIDKLPATEPHLVRNVTRHLTEEFAGTFGPETIEHFVADSLDELVPRAAVCDSLPAGAEPVELSIRRQSDFGRFLDALVDKNTSTQRKTGGGKAPNSAGLPRSTVQKWPRSITHGV